MTLRCTLSLSVTCEPSVYTALKLLMWHHNGFVGWQEMRTFDKEGNNKTAAFCCVQSKKNSQRKQICNWNETFTKMSQLPADILHFCNKASFHTRLHLRPPPLFPGGGLFCPLFAITVMVKKKSWQACQVFPIHSGEWRARRKQPVQPII